MKSGFSTNYVSIDKILVTELKVSQKIIRYKKCQYSESNNFLILITKKHGIQRKLTDDKIFELKYGNAKLTNAWKYT